jgi:hypothetical protein
VRQILILVAFLVASRAPAQSPAGDGCRAVPNAKVLDFWVGEWTVRETGKTGIDGNDRIELILGGCAVLEHWVGINTDDKGESFFYFAPGSRRWKQVWTTQHAELLGGLKEKEMVAVYPNHAVRFQGNLSTPNGVTVIDRTTLTPLDNGTVHQVIEVSRDGGQTWVVSYDAIYTKKG